MAQQQEAYDYRQLNAELEAILDAMQSADIDIDTAISKYERGMAILALLEQRLKTAEIKIKKLRVKFENE